MKMFAGSVSCVSGSCSAASEEADLPGGGGGGGGGGEGPHD